MTRVAVGVALCGAELAGTAHIGVLFALEHLGIQPKMIAGTSSGALVASLYAHGYSFDEFRKTVATLPLLHLLDYGFPILSSVANMVQHNWRRDRIKVPNGVLRGKGLRRYIQSLHRNRLPKMPLYIVANDLYSTDSVVFTNDERAVQRGYAQRSTDVATEIAGSCSIPGLFTPFRHRGWMLVDGGVRDQIPVSALRKAGCDRIFAVNVHDLSGGWYPITTVDVLQRSLMALLDEAVDGSDLAPDVFVVKPELVLTSLRSYRKCMLQNIELGYKYIYEHREAVREFIQ